MNNIDEETIKTLIAESQFLADVDDSDIANRNNEEVKNILTAVMQELCRYSRDVNTRILNKTISSDNSCVIPEIYTTFIEKPSDLSLKDKLYKMVDIKDEDAASFNLLNNDDYTYKRVFLREEFCNIKKILSDIADNKCYDGICENQGEQKRFNYRLCFDNSYIKIQELIYRYAQHYDIANPVIFSPWSYKSFFLIFPAEVQDMNLDFSFKENGLNVSSGNSQIYWNIRCSDKDAAPDAEVPYEDEVRYIYKFQKSRRGNYELPMPKSDSVRIFDIKFSEDFVEISTDCRICSFYLLESMPLNRENKNVRDALKKNILLTNSLSNSYHGIRNGRILSEADAEHAIAPFRNGSDWLKCERLPLGHDEVKIVDRYPSNILPVCAGKIHFKKVFREYLLFSGDQSVEFAYDYVNYVLQTLEYFYPDIEWAGMI